MWIYRHMYKPKMQMNQHAQMQAQRSMLLTKSKQRGPCVEEGAPVTRPVGVLDPAPPKGCSCVG